MVSAFEQPFYFCQRQQCTPLCKFPLRRYGYSEELVALAVFPFTGFEETRQNSGLVRVGKRAETLNDAIGGQERGVVESLLHENVWFVSV